MSLLRSQPGGNEPGGGSLKPQAPSPHWGHPNPCSPPMGAQDRVPTGRHRGRAPSAGACPRHTPNPTGGLPTRVHLCPQSWVRVHAPSTSTHTHIPPQKINKYLNWACPRDAHPRHPPAHPRSAGLASCAGRPGLWPPARLRTTGDGKKLNLKAARPGRGKGGGCGAAPCSPTRVVLGDRAWCGHEGAAFGNGEQRRSCARTPAGTSQRRGLTPDPVDTGGLGWSWQK